MASITILVNCNIQMSDTEANSLCHISGCDRSNGGIWSRPQPLVSRLNRGVKEPTNVYLWNADGSLWVVASDEYFWVRSEEAVLGSYKGG